MCIRDRVCVLCAFPFALGGFFQYNGMTLERFLPVSYTHLDVYKRQLENSARCCGLSKTAYLRRLILGAEVRALPSQEIKALRTCLLYTSRCV